MISMSRVVLASAAAAIKQSVAPKWDIYAAVAICRQSVVAPRMNPVQQRFADMQSTIEGERAYKSDFDLRMDQDKILLAKRAQLEADGKDLSQLDGEIGIAAEVQEDEWKRREETFLTANPFDVDKVTANANPKSYARFLDQKLVLLTRQRFSPASKDYQSPWILPQWKNEGEPLRQTVEHFLGEIFLGDTQLTIYGNAPAWHVTYKYPKKLRQSLSTDSVGGKVFVFPVVLHHDINEDFVVNDKVIGDYHWATATEAGQLLGSGNPFTKHIPHLLYA